jgi:RimJ/RimL family protein N-acetyltransferase
VSITFRRLDTSSRAALEVFACRDFSQPWTDVVEEVVRGQLADELAHGTVAALGAFDDDQRLVGVAAWKPPDERGIVQNVVCAVAFGFQRRGVGTELKRNVLREGVALRAIAVVSEVHVDNDAMLAVNTKLDAVLTHDPDDQRYLICVIRL